MGNSNIKFEANLKKLIYEYVNIIKLLIANDFFATKTIELRDAIDEYIEYFVKDDVSNMSNRNHKIKLIWSVHKIYPSVYNTKTSINVKWMVAACQRQYAFAKKFEKVINNLTSHNIKKLIKIYKFFLLACQKNPKQVLVPTLSEGFVWHAHMQDSEYYSSDMINNFGFVLDHCDDYTEEIMELHIKNTKTIREKDKDYSNGEANYIIDLNNKIWLINNYGNSYHNYYFSNFSNDSTESI